MDGRVSASDWCDVGLVLLRERGMPALTIDGLCAALKRTKGSFYHHFRDLDTYLDALLARWQETLTDSPIEHAGQARDPSARAARLDATVAQLDHRLDLAIRAWALWDERARVAVERVDAQRIAYLAGLHRERGVEHAQRVAELEYVAFIGTQQLRVSSSDDRASRLTRNVRLALAALLEPTTTRAPAAKRPGPSRTRIEPKRR